MLCFINANKQIRKSVILFLFCNSQFFQFFCFFLWSITLNVSEVMNALFISGTNWIKSWFININWINFFLGCLKKVYINKSIKEYKKRSKCAFLSSIMFLIKSFVVILLLLVLIVNYQCTPVLNVDQSESSINARYNRSFLFRIQMTACFD